MRSCLAKVTQPPVKYADRKLAGPGELQPRPAAHSFARMNIPIKSKAQEMLQYMNVYNHVRIGRLLEDLDMFACWIAYRHNSDQENPDGTSPLSIVTACVDSIQIYRTSIPTDKDLYMFGVVSWTGSTSMEITMTLTDNSKWQFTSQHGNDEDVILDAKFLMVARAHGATGKGAQVYPLKVKTDQEQYLWDQGCNNKNLRIQSKTTSLLMVPPTQEESAKIHHIYVSNLDKNKASFRLSHIKSDDTILMSTTKLKSAIICSPEHRNVHNKIFGGFLMRKAAELAEANFQFTLHDACPVCVDVSDISFAAPVEIGSLLMLNSQIIATRNRMAIVRLHAEVMNPETGESKTTNTFYFVFESNTKTLPQIIPESYGESLLCIDGERRLDQTLKRHSQYYKLPASGGRTNSGDTGNGSI